VVVVLFNRDLMFIHIPKAAGTSIREYFKRALPKPVIIYHEIVGTENPHINLPDALQFVLDQGYDPAGFKFFLAVFRNPYAVDVSMYHYMRNTPGNWPKTSDRHLALHSSFDEYLRKSTYWPSFEYYIYLNGRIPDNMIILRVEDDLEQDMRSIVEEIGGNREVEFPHINIQHYGHYVEYYTPELEEIVYNKYRWVFDYGIYERMICPG